MADEAMTTAAVPPISGIDVNGDVDAMLNLRDWMETILKSHGCTITGSGMGFGGGDLWFMHEGAEFFLTVKPVMKDMASNAKS